MPELPEVEIVKCGLSKLIINKKIKSVSFDWQKSFPNSKSDINQFLIDANITGIRRRAKVIIIDLNTNYSLVTHLKMTGQLVYRSDDDQTRFGAGHPSSSLVGDLPDKSTRVTLDFGDSKLFFNDQRKFGWMRLYPQSKFLISISLKKLGQNLLMIVFLAMNLRQDLYEKGTQILKQLC